MLRKEVSIPFKRESVSKEEVLGALKTNEKTRFNSLQTGKCIQSVGCEMKSASPLSFNSLQTGKCIQRIEIFYGHVINQMHKFQFPSNGKVYPKSAGRWPHRQGDSGVSIPFKRESVSKAANTVGDMKANKDMFQFPSNGKVYPKRYSIPDYGTPREFQFPSNGKVYPKTLVQCQPVAVPPSCFNSLQTGKCIQRGDKNRWCTIERCPVSIPFKRESVSKVQYRNSTSDRLLIVSIPFKRESVSKAEGISSRGLGINLFQFPSNGKVYPK